MSETVDLLLGVRRHRAYGCTWCCDLHAEGLDRLFDEHLEHRLNPDEPMEVYTSTEVADYREHVHGTARQ